MKNKWLGNIVDIKSKGYEILESITDEMDLVFGATTYPWKMVTSLYNYDILKEWEANHTPEWWNRPLFFNKDGHEYIRAVENHNVPFILDYRVVINYAPEASKEMPIIELDDIFDPNIEEKQKADWKKHQDLMDQGII